MTQEEKELLLKDLCARLPYEVKCLVNFDDGTKEIMTLKTGLPNSFGRWDFYNENCSGCSNNFKPYLRPMSSMTEEEREELSDYLCEQVMSNKIGITIPPNPTQGKGIPFIWMGDCMEWLNAHHFDYRGLIEKGLAIAVTEENKPYYK